MKKILMRVQVPDDFEPQDIYFAMSSKKNSWQPHPFTPEILEDKDADYWRIQYPKGMALAQRLGLPEFVPSKDRVEFIRKVIQEETGKDICAIAMFSSQA